MRKTINILLFVTLLFTGCQKEIEGSDIPKINGYWEIKQVILSDGEKKDYTINDTFDYFEIKNNKGFRKKVMPQFDGTFLTNDIAEKVEVKKIKNKYYLYYTTSYVKWNEELLSVSDNELVIINNMKNEYHYKRAAPINITRNGKTIK